ncbi:MAG: glycoside hydrolase [bacterium]|nr:glycoside hydrolase [bacterium]
MKTNTKPGKIVLQIDPTDQNPRHSEASFITLKSGRIVFAWSKFSGSTSDFAEAVIATKYSDDDGKTWSREDKVLIQKEGTTNVMSPSLLRLQDGKIAVVYLRKDGRKICMPYIRTSEDELETLSEPISIAWEPGYYVVNNDRMIQMKCGRIIVPAALHRYRGPSVLIPGEEVRSFFSSPALILFFLSDDGGKNWLESLTNYYRCFPSGHGLQEPGVIELKNGRLWSWTRPGEEGRQWQSFSDDQGQTWTEPEPSQFVSPSSPMHVKRIPKTGDLLVVWNDHSRIFETEKPEPISRGRTPLVCAISDDEGKSWKHHKLLEDSPRHGFCYPAIHFTEDAVLISYCVDGETSRGSFVSTLRMRRILIEELYA